MNTTFAQLRSLRVPKAAGFSLIELLVVLAIIAILAGMLMTGFGGAGRNKQVAAIKGSRAEIVTAIEEYNAKRGFYPPTPVDAANNPILDKPTLYYELVGTRFDDKDQKYHSLDDQEMIGPGDLKSLFGVAVAFSNSGKQPGDSQNFYINLNKNRRGHADFAGKPAGVDYGVLALPIRSGTSDILIWRYNSYNPTNNPGRFDLWVEWTQANKTEIIGNW
ncbi:MAG: type II secretion system protein [Verrucomicrobia bacterium]|nr:type II secretion system protein [Verrucomicrobiota bacterium]MBI3869953.1 type II secretion system protein [Verrucomicrobiota bacterium]